MEEEMAMAEEVAKPQLELGKEGLACILMHVMFAATYLMPQRDRLLQLRRRLQQHTGDPAVFQELASSLRKVYVDGLHAGSRYLTAGLQITAEHGARDSFSVAAFSVIPNEQLYGVLLKQWLPPRPATQADAFARIESAFYAVKLAEEHHVPRCVELLVGVRPPPVIARPFRSVVGYSDDTVQGVNEHLAKNGFPEPEPAPAASATQTQANSSVDPDQALSYLHRACSLASLAVKHVDVAIAAISSWLDPEDVADTSQWVADISEIAAGRSLPIG
ncbi:uncharacterized protein [Lolium perenne]|uniref:uncharacterized protein isoform X2 n=1 Tax=Lolium perenne TaxID=4522 RepID=UPI0021F67C9F|nr:uncharacterized protein LOC127340700 isoform X2 [Lolium perenne]